MTLANWYDLSDATASFEKRVPLEALSQPLLFNAIVAFAAIHLSKTTTASLRPIADGHHEKCVKFLINLKEDDVEAEDGITLAAVCLLRSYEILGEEFDPNRHLSGAFALAMNRSHNLHQPSLARAGFFNFMREDITYSLINRCPLKIDVDDMDIFEANNDEDQLNVATLHLAMAINQTFEGTATTKSATPILEMFEKWCEALPVQFTPYFETRHQQQSRLPTIRMLRDCHVSVVQYRLVTRSVLDSPHNAIGVEGRLHDYAARICGLAFTSESPAVVVNSFGPISFACQFLKGQSFRLELIRRLHGCRKETGWPVRRIIDDLEQYWAQADG
jgi:hypothetical protein